MKRVKKTNTVKLIGLILVFLTMSSSIASAQAAWPWEKPSAPDVPAWEPQREWVAPPDETPPTVKIDVLSMLSPDGETTETPTSESSYTDEDGNFVRPYQMDADKDMWLFRIQVTVKEGLSGLDEDGYYASGIDASSAVLHVGGSEYSLTEEDATKDQPNKANFKRRSIQLTKGMEDVRVWAECADNKGNAASSDQINLRVRSGEEDNGDGRSDEEIKALWETVKIKAKRSEGSLRLDTTKNQWYYYVVTKHVARSDGTTLRHGSDKISDQQTTQKQAYFNASQDFAKRAEFGYRVFYFWTGKGTFAGWMTGLEPDWYAINTGSDAKDLVGGDYGGKYTGLGD